MKIIKLTNYNSEEPENHGIIIRVYFGEGFMYSRKEGIKFSEITLLGVNKCIRVQETPEEIDALLLAKDLFTVIKGDPK